MSSFPDHEDNIRDLAEIGFDISDAIKDGEVSMDSWGYDELVYLISGIVHTLKEQGFKVSPK